MLKKIDFLAVGDIVTDAFIELQEAWIETDNPEKSEELCMRFGDKLPYKDVVVVPAVGNSPNAAVSAHRLGLNSALVTDLGDDPYGQEQVAQLKKEGVSTDYVQTHKGKKSNYHFVLRFKEERTILVKHEEYEYKFPEMDPPKWLYLSSLAENSLPYHAEIVEFLKNNPETNLAFQPGTFQMKLGIEKLKDLYKLSKVFFCNVEEAKRILHIKEKIEILDLLKKMHEAGPEIAVITDGPNGAYAYDGEEAWFMPIYPDPKPPVDRTGAGDSFSSTFTGALALGKTIPEALSWAPINSMSVVQKIGAQEGLLTKEKLEEFLANAPEDYKPKRIS